MGSINFAETVSCYQPDENWGGLRSFATAVAYDAQGFARGGGSRTPLVTSPYNRR